MDFLNVDQLHNLHARCLATANQRNSKLIIEYPLDFFQVKLSYVYTKDDVVLMLHVPMVPTDALDEILIVPNSSLPRQPLNLNHPKTGPQHSRHL